MSSFEWMELQSLSADIAEARKRLAEARSLKDDRLIRTLEQEITTAEAQRARIVMQLSTHFADNTEQGSVQYPPPPPDAGSDPGQDEPDEPFQFGELTQAADDNDIPIPVADEPPPAHDAFPVADSLAESGAVTEPEWPSQEPAGTPSLGRSTITAMSGRDDNSEGDKIVWDQLTPTDLERAKEELATRRTEMLARHAEELKALEADGSQLEELERAITAFLRKFSSPSDADVVKLGEERELRLGRA